MKPRELAGRVIRGYARFFRSLAQAVLVLAGMAGIALGVSYPVWWLAVKHRGLYSTLVAGACLAVVAFLLIRRLGARKDSSAEKVRGAWFSRLSAWTLAAAGAYGTAVLGSRSAALGILAAVVLLGLFGVWLFGFSQRRR